MDPTVAYDQPKVGQVGIFLIHQAIEMKSLNHHFLCPMQFYMNGVLINEVPKFLSFVLRETMHAIQIVHPFNVTHQIIIPLQLNGLNSYFDVRKPTKKKYEDQNILKKELMS